MDSIQYESDSCNPYRRWPSPAENLLERLLLGGAIDAELRHRLQQCAAFFDEHPLARLGWTSRLREATRCPLTAHLWPVVAPILARPASA